MRLNTDGTGLQSVGPPSFGRLNDIHVHKNGYGSAYSKIIYHFSN